MDSFELNKIMGAVLATCLFVLSLNIAAGAVFAPPKMEKPGYVIAVPDAPASGGGETAKAEPAEPLPEPAPVEPLPVELLDRLKKDDGQ